LKKLRHKATEDDIKKACKYVEIDEFYVYALLVKTTQVSYSYLEDGRFSRQ
jgi:hypothetical protein